MLIGIKMGKKLAIKGHSTRGDEVIALLEMMGGKNVEGFIGTDSDELYTIEDNDIIQSYDWNNCVCFTLEEFLEKYPFKIGDKVTNGIDFYTIKSMSWSKDWETMVYDFEDSVIVLAADDMKLIDDKCERTHEDAIFDSIIWHLRNSVNNGKQNLSGGECEDYFREVVKKNKMKTVLAELLEHIKTTPKEELEREFEEIKEWSNVGPTVEEFRTFCESVNRKPKYPTTYAECCEVLMGKTNFSEFSLVPIKYSNTTKFDNDVSPDAPHIELFNNLYKIFICRNAYWKIAGEQMGLDKPWESPLPSLFETIHCIRRKNNEIIKGSYRGGKSEILEFPTEEMRDAFYENFKDLIEKCKELL